MASIRDYLTVVEAGGQPPRGAAVGANLDVEKWTRIALRDAGIQATVAHGHVYVRAAGDKPRAERLLRDTVSLSVKLPVDINRTPMTEIWGDRSPMNRQIPPDPAATDRISLEKWTRTVLDDAGISAQVMAGQVEVRSVADQQRAEQVIQQSIALKRKLPVVVVAAARR